jgi:hypothetical protein
MKKYTSGGPNPVYLPPWRYLTEETITGDGTSQNLNLPTNAHIVEMRPEGGAMYYSINGMAQASSGGYIPGDGGGIIGPISNLNSVGVWAADSVVIHVIYYRENVAE